MQVARSSRNQICDLLDLPRPIMKVSIMVYNKRYPFFLNRPVVERNKANLLLKMNWPVIEVNND